MQLRVLLFSVLIYINCYGNVDSLLNKGSELYSHGDYAKAIDVLTECAKQAEKGADKKMLCNIYNNLGNAWSRTGESVNALKYYQLSIKIAEQLNDKNRIGKTLKNMGALYSEQKDFGTAMKYYENGLAIAIEVKDSILIADFLNNEGVVFEQQKKYDEAVDVYTKALAIYSSKNDESKISMSLNNLAIVYKYLKNYNQSIKNYEAAIALSKKLDDKFMLAANLNNLGNVYALTGNYKQSLELCTEGLQIAKEIDANEVVIEAYDGISTAYQNMGDLRKALEYRKLYEKEKDAFINKERSLQLAEMKTKYESEKKENEIVLLKKNAQIKNLELQEQNHKLTKRNYFLAGFAILFVLLLTGGYLWNKNEKIKNRIRQQLAAKEIEEKERIRIARDIHDDLGSGLSKINFLSGVVSSNQALQPEVAENVKTISEIAVRLVDNMRDLIWALNPENTTVANLLAQIREYTSDYLEDFPIALKASFPEDVPQKPISKESHHSIYMVIKEALNNMIKHSQASIISIEVQFQQNMLTILLADNGIGFSTEEKRDGNGLRNMTSRITASQGKFHIDSAPGKGTSIMVTMPIA